MTPEGGLGGEFRALSNILGSDPDCAMPLLTAVPDSDIDSISDQCIIATPPDVGGSITITDMGGGNFAVSAVQDLAFTISAEVMISPTLTLTATIVSTSQTTLTGTGTGAIEDGGSITLDALEGPLAAFNINAAATGNVDCSA